MRGRIILDVVILLIVIAFASTTVFVLNSNSLDHSLDIETKISNIDNKINWLYYLVVILVALIAFGFTHASYC